MISKQDIAKVFHKELCEDAGKVFTPEFHNEFGGKGFTPGVYLILNTAPNDEYPNAFTFYFLLRSDGTGIAYDKKLRKEYTEVYTGGGLGFLDSYKNQRYPKFSVEKIA